MDLWCNVKCNSLHFGFIYILHRNTTFLELESFEHTDTCTVLLTTQSFLNWLTVSNFIVLLPSVWLCNNSSEFSLSLISRMSLECAREQGTNKPTRHKDTVTWYQYRTSEVKFVDGQQHLLLFTLITQTIRIWPTSYWHTDTHLPAENMADRSNRPDIYPPAFSLLPATDQSFVKSPVRWNYSDASCPVRWRQGSWAVQAPRLHMYPRRVAETSGEGGWLAEHMDACCWVSRRHLHRSTLTLTLWP